jgi:hypothetical protein
MTASLTVPIVAGMGKAVNAASDLEQATGAVNIVFGDSADIIEKFGQTSATAVGLAESEFKQLSAVTGSFLQNLGYDADEAANQTIILTERASDMAAVFDTDVSQALEAIQSGLKGEFNPLEQFGVKMNAAAIEAKALEMGLAATKSELDDNAKAQAALAIVMEQTDRIAGQFSRESESFAGKMQRLKARFSDAAAELGQRLLPVAIDLLEWASDMLDRFDALDPKQKDMIVNIAGITAAIGPLLIVGGKMLTWTSSMITIIPKLTTKLIELEAASLGAAGALGILAAALTVEVLLQKKIFNNNMDVVDSVAMMNEEIAKSSTTYDEYLERVNQYNNDIKKQTNYTGNLTASVSNAAKLVDVMTESEYEAAIAIQSTNNSLTSAEQSLIAKANATLQATGATQGLTTAEDKLSETLDIARDALSNANIPLADRERLMRELNIAAGDATIQEYELKDAVNSLAQAYADGELNRTEYIEGLGFVESAAGGAAGELWSAYQGAVLLWKWMNTHSYGDIMTGAGYSSGGSPSQGYIGYTASPKNIASGSTSTGSTNIGKTTLLDQAVGGFYSTNSPTLFRSSEYGQRERAIFIPQGKTIFDVATVNQIADIMPKGEFGTRKVENHYHLNANYKYQSPISLMDEVRLREAAGV